MMATTETGRGVPWGYFRPNKIYLFMKIAPAYRQSEDRLSPTVASRGVGRARGLPFREYNCGSVRVVDPWNSLPDETKQQETLNGFKNSLDNFYGWGGQQNRMANQRH